MIRNRYFLLKTFIFLLCLLLFSTPIFATTYYLDGTLGADCAGGAGTSYDVSARDCSASGGIVAWNDLATANTILDAGDTLYMRGGTEDYETYNVGTIDSATEGIHPDNTGTSGNVITYATYQTEMVHLVGTELNSKAVIIEDKNYIHVTGYDGSTSAMNLKVSNMYWFLYIWSTSSTGGAGSDYCEVDHIEFTTNVGATTDYRGSTIYRNSQYNWIHDCTFSKFGFYTTSQDCGSLFELGNEGSSTADDTAYNVIENNKFFHGGHHTFGLHRMYNVVRNNHFHNEKWWYYSGDGEDYSYRNLYIAGYTGPTYHGYNLIENNRISHAGPNLNPGNCGGSAISLNQSNVIIRYNNFYANGLGGIFIQAGSGEECDGNHIYNNTWLSNGFLDNTQPSNQEGCLSATDYKRRPICVWDYNTEEHWADYEGIVIKNNLMWKNQQGPEGADQIVTDADAWPPDIVVTNNWSDLDGDPKFTDEGSYSSPSMEDPDFDGCDPTSITNPNLSLQPNSPVIDQGTYLTQANGSGSTSTTLIVDDAKYFQPGWGDGAGGGASVPADWLIIGTTVAAGDIVQIGSINYSTNTITLASVITWADDDYVWLYKDSDGTVVLKGTAPEIGAYEQLDETAPTIPNVTSDTPNGTYTTGKVVDIDVTISEPCTSTGNVTVTTDIGRTCTFTLTAESFGTCNITVLDGDNTSDLTVTDISGTIVDAAENAMVNFTPTTNLAANKAIVIQTDIGPIPPGGFSGGACTGPIQ